MTYSFNIFNGSAACGGFLRRSAASITWLPAASCGVLQRLPVSGRPPPTIPQLHPRVRAVVWACGREQTDRRARPIYISRRQRLTRNVISVVSPACERKHFDAVPPRSVQLTSMKTARSPGHWALVRRRSPPDT